MGKKVAGVDVLLKVSEADGTVKVLGGQTGATLNRDAETIDVTDKTSGGWASSIAGTLSWSVDADGFVVLGDEALEQLEDSFMERKEISVEIRIGGDAEAEGVTYTGKGYLVSLPLEMAQDDAVTYSVSITGSTKLTRVKGVKSV